MSRSPDVFRVQQLKGAAPGTPAAVAQRLQLVADLFCLRQFLITVDQLVFTAFKQDKLVALTEDTAKRYALLKENRGVMDFNDMEHFALKALLRESVAREMRDAFTMVLVDEYQDTNQVQEAILARIAKEAGALAIGVVTKPFTFEGSKRRNVAEDGLGRLKEQVDTLIIIPNDRLLEVVDKKVSLQAAFRAADDVLRQGIQGISELITVPGLINLDFADVKAIMGAGGAALMAVGRASGENRSGTGPA
jgi:hypothetical protein